MKLLTPIELMLEERARFRKALRKIAEACEHRDGDSESDWIQLGEEVLRIAQQALAE